MVMGFGTSVINLPLMGYVAAVSAHSQLAAYDIYIPTAAILVVLMFMAWVIGKFLYWIALAQAEQEFAFRTNPEWMRMCESKAWNKEPK